METRGVPAALVVTGPFEAIAKKFARSFGLGDFQPVAVPHGISRGDDELLRSQAERIAPLVWQRLTGATVT